MPAALPPSRRPLGPIPDLLSAEPALRVPYAELRQALVFAFAVGGSIESFQEIVGRATLPPSAWDSAHFERDLYLDAFVDRLVVRIGNVKYAAGARYLMRAIAEPPVDSKVIAFRRNVLGELAESAPLRAEFEALYVELVALRALLCAGRQPAPGLRRLEILRALHKILGTLADSFEGATSGLGRLREFGAAARDSVAYQRLSALLDHEGHLGSVDLRVRVGADGEIRTFQILAIRENVENPFHSSPLARLFAKIRLFFRGIRMSGGEVVERLFDDVFTGLEGSLVALFQLMADMEFYLASLGFRDLAQANHLEVCFPEFVDPATPDASAGMVLRGLFNPWLLEEKVAPVPCDLELSRAGSVVFVTGPNSGGKTRLLQALAFAQLLGEAGMFVPAAAARLSRVAGMFVSLRADERADQPEGHLGMELMRIRRMFEELSLGSLVLIDELCSGTNPSEGEEIAELVISLLPELRAQVFVTTHLLQFAARLAKERPIPGLEFLQVELGPGERPTYRFIPGVARTSLAHKTAARLGVTQSELLALIAAKKRALGMGETSPVVKEEDSVDPRVPSDARESAADLPPHA